MSNQQILEKAIRKAIDGGFDYLGKPENGWGVGKGEWHTTDYHLCIGVGSYDKYIHFAEIIFNHDFAKALWGEGVKTYDREAYTGNVGRYVRAVEPWKDHLQNMVVADDPIKYLGDNI